MIHLRFILIIKIEEGRIMIYLYPRAVYLGTRRVSERENCCKIAEHIKSSYCGFNLKKPHHGTPVISIAFLYPTRLKKK